MIQSKNNAGMAAYKIVESISNADTVVNARNVIEGSTNQKGCSLVHKLNPLFMMIIVNAVNINAAQAVTKPE